MTIAQKKEWAELLYSRTQMTQKEISERVEVTEKTLSAWKQKHNWDELRTSFFITKGQQLQRIYQQITALNDSIIDKEEGKRFATSSEADVISKLAAAAKNLESEISISDIVDVFIDFTDWLRENDFSRAKEVSELMDAYIKNKTRA